MASIVLHLDEEFQCEIVFMPKAKNLVLHSTRLPQDTAGKLYFYANIKDNLCISDKELNFIIPLLLHITIFGQENAQNARR